MKFPVLLPKVFDYPFTYLNDKNKNLKQGDLVVVPFGKKKGSRCNLGQNTRNDKKN